MVKVAVEELFSKVVVGLEDLLVLHKLVHILAAHALTFLDEPKHLPLLITLLNLLMNQSNNLFKMWIWGLLGRESEVGRLKLKTLMAIKVF